VFASLGQGVAQGILGIGSRFFRKVFFGHFLDLDADLKLTGFQLALLGFEDLTLSLHGILLQILLVGKDLGDIRHEVRHSAGLRGQDLLRLAEGLESLLLVRHRVGSLGLGDLLDGTGHVRDGFALKEGELSPSKPAQGLFVYGLLTGLHESLEKLSVAINDRLLGAAQASLVNLGGILVPVGLDPPLLGLALHELLGLDDLADLLHEEIVDQDSVGAGDDLAELFHDFLNGLARFREMRVGVLRFTGAELLTGIGELIAGSHHLLGAKSPQGVAGFIKGVCSAFLGESIGLQVLEEKAEAPYDRIHTTAHAVLPIDLGPKALLGPYDAVGPVLFLLGKARKGQKARGGDGQGE
jgi:hypothetical protein